MQPGRDRPLADPRQVEAVAVIGNLNHDLAVEVFGLKPDLPFFGLAAAAPPIGTLNAVIGGVADQMQTRVAHVFENLAVQLGIATLHLDSKLLS